MLKSLNREKSKRNTKVIFMNDTSDVHDLLNPNVINNDLEFKMLSNQKDEVNITSAGKNAVIELIKMNSLLFEKKSEINNEEIEYPNDIKIKQNNSNIMADKPSTYKKSFLKIDNVNYNSRKSTKDRLPNILKFDQAAIYSKSHRTTPKTNREKYTRFFTRDSHKNNLPEALRMIKLASRHSAHGRSSHLNPEKIAEAMKDSEKNSPYTKYQNRKIKIDIIISILLCINIILSIVDNELYIDYSDKYLSERMQEENKISLDEGLLSEMGSRELKYLENLIRFINGFVCILSSFLMIARYLAVLKIKQIDKKLSEYDNLFNSGMLKNISLDVFICIFFYPPFLKYIITGRQLGLLYGYSINSIISVLVLVKLRIIIRVFEYYSRWTTDTAKSFCNKYKVTTGIHFAIKAEMKKRPFYILSTCLILMMIIFGFATRAFEYGVFSGNESKRIKGNNDLQNLASSFWFIIVTMTTVGYGDYVPKSHPGRFIGVLSSFLGMMLLSLIVVSLGSITEFTLEEKKAFSKLKKLMADDNLENKAANVVKEVFMLRKFIVSLKEENKHYDNNKKLFERFILLTRLKIDVSCFKNDYKIAKSLALPVEEVLTRFQNQIENYLEKINENIAMANDLNEDLKSVLEGQELIQNRMKNVIEMQEDIGVFIINLNNENYVNKLKLKLSNTPSNDFNKLASFKKMNSLMNNIDNLKISNLSIDEKNSKIPKNKVKYLKSNKDINSNKIYDIKNKTK